MRKIIPFNVTAEYVMIIIALGYSLWLFFGSITELLLPLDALKKISGTVSRVEHNAFEYRPYRGPAGKYKSVTLSLTGSQSNFKVTGLDIDTGTFESIEKGDEIDLYTKHGYRYPFFSSANEIYHLERGQTILLDINSRKPGNRFLLICSCILITGLLFILVMYPGARDYR